MVATWRWGKSRLLIEAGQVLVKDVVALKHIEGACISDVKLIPVGQVIIIDFIILVDVLIGGMDEVTDVGRCCLGSIEMPALCVTCMRINEGIPDEFLSSDEKVGDMGSVCAFAADLEMYSI